MANSEKQIVNKIKSAITEAGGYVVKTHGSPATAGLPDLFVCYEGRFVGIEVKKPTTRNTVTARQQANLEAITSAGGIAGVATSVEEALELLL